MIKMTEYKVTIQRRIDGEERYLVEVTRNGASIKVQSVPYKRIVNFIDGQVLASMEILPKNQKINKLEFTISGENLR